MPSKLDNLKQKIQNKNEEGSLVTSLYYLIKELKCLPEIVGRQYEGYFKIWKWRVEFKFRQKPIAISTLMTLFHELEEDVEKQEKEMKKSERKGRR